MKTIFIGPLGGGKTPDNGASIKNYHIVKKLKEYIPNLKTIDTENWKRNPFILANLLITILSHPNDKFILSLNTGSANRTIRIINKLTKRAQLYYWVIGGTIGTQIQKGIYTTDDYSWITKILVEGNSMKKQLESVGLKNAIVVPNFKSINKIPIFNKKTNSNKIKFVFLSRIKPEKGCNLIIEATRILNKEGFQERFSIDFFGPVEDTYKEGFLSEISQIENITYKGFLDLRDVNNYFKLSQYDALLFPTYWQGEGFPGIIIDAFSSGLPVLASEWNLNSDLIENNKTGIIFQPQSVGALLKTMKECIEGNYDLVALGNQAKKLVKNYDTNVVLSKENLKSLGII